MNSGSQGKGELRLSPLTAPTTMMDKKKTREWSGSKGKKPRESFYA